METPLDIAKAVLQEYCSESCEAGACTYENHVIARAYVQLDACITKVRADLESYAKAGVGTTTMALRILRETLDV